jgi:hypothetical protein
MGKLMSYQQQLQDIVAKGINSAEEQEKKLSAKPFNYAEKLESEARAYSVKTLRKRYNGYRKDLFEQLRGLNNRVGSFGADLVAKIEKETAEGADAVASEAGSVVNDATKVREAAKAPPKKSTASKSTADKSTAKKSTTSPA